MKNPSINNFNLKKLKLPTGGGVSLDYALIEIVGGESYESNQSQKSTKEPHPDLSDLFAKLVPMVAQVFCLTLINSVVQKKEFKADALQIDIITKYVEQMTSRIRINGISLSGSEDKKGIVISAGYRVDNNQIVAINTPRILFSGSSRGFEEDLEIIVEEIEKEAYSFIYENKVANPEMMFSE
jgi:hypothetical protein